MPKQQVLNAHIYTQSSVYANGTCGRVKQYMDLELFLSRPSKHNSSRETLHQKIANMDTNDCRSLFFDQL